MNIKQMVLTLAMSVVVSESRAMDIGWRDVVAIAGFTYAVKRIYDRGVEAGAADRGQVAGECVNSNGDVILEGTKNDIAAFRNGGKIVSRYGKVTVKITPETPVAQPVYPGQRYQPYVADQNNQA